MVSKISLPFTAAYFQHNSKHPQSFDILCCVTKVFIHSMILGWDFIRRKSKHNSEEGGGEKKFLFVCLFWEMDRVFYNSKSTRARLST